MKLNYNRFFFHFSEMRILTHIKSLLRFKLKLVTLVTSCSIQFLPNFDIFVTFFLFCSKLNFVPFNKFLTLLETLGDGVRKWIRPYTRFAKFPHHSLDKCKNKVEKNPF